MPTTIEIYPPQRRPSWVRVGALCEVNGEGGGVLHRIVEVDTKGYRAGVERVGGGGFSWWESYYNLNRPTKRCTCCKGTGRVLRSSRKRSP